MFVTVSLTLSLPISVSCSFNSYISYVDWLMKLAMLTHCYGISLWHIMVFRRNHVYLLLGSQSRGHCCQIVRLFKFVFLKIAKELVLILEYRFEGSLIMSLAFRGFIPQIIMISKFTFFSNWTFFCLFLAFHVLVCSLCYFILRSQELNHNLKQPMTKILENNDTQLMKLQDLVLFYPLLLSFCFAKSCKPLLTCLKTKKIYDSLI